MAGGKPLSFEAFSHDAGVRDRMKEEFRSVFRETDPSLLTLLLDTLAPTVIILTGVLVLFSRQLLQPQWDIGSTQVLAALGSIGGGVAWMIARLDRARAGRDEARKANRDRMRKAAKVVIRQLASLSEGTTLKILQEELRRMGLSDDLVIAEALDELLDSKVLTVRDGAYFFVPEK